MCVRACAGCACLLHVLHDHADSVLHVADLDDAEQLDHVRVAEPPQQLRKTTTTEQSALECAEAERLSLR
jgi:hypothetical protein